MQSSWSSRANSDSESCSRLEIAYQPPRLEKDEKACEKKQRNTFGNVSIVNLFKQQVAYLCITHVAFVTVLLNLETLFVF